MRRLRGVINSVFSGQAWRQRRAAREFNRLVEAYDIAIERARAKHQPTSSLIAAKRDFVHAMLRAEVAR